MRCSSSRRVIQFCISLSASITICAANPSMVSAAGPTPTNPRPELVVQCGHAFSLFGARSIAFNNDGNRLLTASRDGFAAIWNSRTGEKLYSLEGHSDSILCATFSADGKRAATGGNDGAIIVWDAHSGKKLQSLPATATAVAFSPDGVQLLSKGVSAILWDLRTGKRIHELTDQGACSDAIAFSPDGKRVVTTGYDAMLCDTATGKKLLKCKGNESAIKSLAFSPDGQKLLAGTRDGTAIIWNCANGEEIRHVDPIAGPVYSVAFSPDGKEFVTATRKSTIFWNAQSGKKLRQINLERREIGTVAYSTDWKQVAIASNEQTAAVRDAANGEKICALSNHRRDMVGLVAFRSNGIVLGNSWVGKSATSILWDTATNKIQTRKRATNIVLPGALSPDGGKVADVFGLPMVDDPPMVNLLASVISLGTCCRRSRPCRTPKTLARF